MARKRRFQPHWLFGFIFNFVSFAEALDEVIDRDVNGARPELFWVTAVLKPFRLVEFCTRREMLSPRLRGAVIADECLLVAYFL